jgi:hypothetical protein
MSLIQDLLGHANFSTTQIVYAKYEQQTLPKGFDEFNPTVTELVAEVESEQELRRVSKGGSDVVPSAPAK